MEKFLKSLQLSTKCFIDTDPTDVVFTPEASSDTARGAGGGLIRAAGTPRPSQRVKLIHQGGSGIKSGEGGSDFSYEYVIVALHDAVIEKGDKFYIGKQKFVVNSKDPFNGYEVKVYATQFGGDPTDG